MAREKNSDNEDLRPINNVHNVEVKYGRNHLREFSTNVI